MTKKKTQQQARDQKMAKQWRKEMREMEHQRFIDAMGPNGRIPRDIAELVRGILLDCPAGPERDAAIGCVCLMYHNLVMAGLAHKP